MDKQSLQKFVDCPVCFGVQQNVHFYQCQHGHAICQPCYLKVKRKCPVCRGDYDDPPRRDRRLEDIVATADLDFKCENASEGCTYVGHKKRLERHQTGSCEYKLVPCIMDHCNKKVAKKMMEQHVKSEHISCSFHGCEFQGNQMRMEWHQTECIYRHVPCPTGICSTKVRCLELSEHLRRDHDTVEVTWLDQCDPDKSVSVVWEFHVSGRRSIRRMIAFEQSNRLIFVRCLIEKDKTAHIWAQVAANKRVSNTMCCETRIEGSSVTLTQNCDVVPIEMSEIDIIKEENLLQLSPKMLSVCLRQKKKESRTEGLELLFKIAEKSEKGT